MRCNDVARERGRFLSNPGDPIHRLYTAEIDDDGVIQLVEAGTQNTDEVIQSYYESTTLEVILAKYANGDLDALNRYQPIYADVTKGPKTLAESMQIFINGEHAFNSLPKEIRQQFDNNWQKWLMTGQTAEWQKIMKPYLAPDPAPNSAPAEKEKPAETSSP